MSTFADSVTDHRHIRLGLFLFLPGHHLAGWRLPGVDPGGAASLGAYKAVARACETARLDMLFIGDTLALPHMAPGPLGRTSRAEAIDPLLVLSALASVTENVGLVATATTTYTEPFLLARQFASLDHLSGGRAGWNLVTSSNQREAENFGADGHSDHTDRYARAEEFLAVVKKLWSSWDDDAVIHDKSTGRFFDPAKVHAIQHKGTHFSVEGPLTLQRPPQGSPVLVQAGSSEPGKDLGARTADVVFTAHQTVEAARAFYDDMKARAAHFGRSPSQLLVMPGIMPIVGRTREEADALERSLSEGVDDEVGLALLGEISGGADFSRFDPDGPFPSDLSSNAGKSRLGLLSKLARDENLSLRELGRRVATGRGHLVVKGTPSDIADVMEYWYTTGAADGFNIMAPAFNKDFNDRLADITAELSARALFRNRYETRTLRGHLNL